MKALLLNGSLKSRPSESHTQILCEMVADALRKNGADPEIAFLNKLRIEPGVAVDPADDMYNLFQSIARDEILVLGTPIWWGQPSSLIQKVLERMTAFDDYYIETDRSLLYGKVLGVAVTGTDDGSQSCMARLMAYGSQLGFTVPAEAFATYQNVDEDLKKVREDKDTQEMVRIMARNLAAWSAAIEESGVVERVQRSAGNRTGILASDARKLGALVERDSEQAKLPDMAGAYLRVSSSGQRR